MNLLIETKNLSYLKDSKIEGIDKGDAPAPASHPAPADDLNDGSPIGGAAGLAAAAVVPASIIGWQKIRHNIGF